MQGMLSKLADPGHYDLSAGLRANANASRGARHNNTFCKLSKLSYWLWLWLRLWLGLCLWLRLWLWLCPGNARLLPRLHQDQWEAPI